MIGIHQKLGLKTDQWRHDYHIIIIIINETHIKQKIPPMSLPHPHPHPHQLPQGATSSHWRSNWKEEKWGEIVRPRAPTSWNGPVCHKIGGPHMMRLFSTFTNQTSLHCRSGQNPFNGATRGGSLHFCPLKMPTSGGSRLDDCHERLDWVQVKG